MKSRLFLFTIILLCLSWIAFVSYDIVTKQNEVNLTQYFSPEDGKILVIHHADEVNWQENNLQVLTENKQILESIQSKISNNTSIFISEKRSVLIIEKLEKWRKEEISDLFSSGIFPFEMVGLNEFTFGKYKGVVSANQLLLHKLDELALSGHVLTPDKKSSFSLIYWQEEGLIYEDVYCRKDKNITYKRYGNKNALNQTVDDKIRFSEIIPSNFDHYAFYSLEQFEQIDSSFSKTVFHSIIDNGIVLLKKEDKQAVLFDFKENQFPIQSLNEHFSKEEKNEDFAQFDSLSFSSFVDTSGRVAYVAQFEEFGIISYDKSYFDALVTDINLGNSISTDTKKMDQLFGDLPMKVSMRVVDSISCFSKSYIGDQTIETIIKRKSLLSKELSKDIKDYFSMNPGERILGFGSFDERGNTIVYTDNKRLHGYINGLKKWTQDISEVPIGIDLSVNRKYLLVHFRSETWVFQKNGTVALRIPKNPEIKPLIANVNGTDLAYTFNGQSFTEYQLNGAINKQFNIGPIREIGFIQENGNDKVVLLGENCYFLYDVRLKKAPKKMTTSHSFNAIGTHGNNWFVHQSGNTVTWLNTTNGQVKSISLPNLKVHDVMVNPSGNALIISSNNSIQTILINGQFRWKQDYEGNDISKIISSQNANGKSIISVFDGIQNQSHLMDQTGKWMAHNTIHSEKDLKINTFGADGYSITTFLGFYLIQYNR